jgi:hypothetical protein
VTRKSTIASQLGNAFSGSSSVFIIVSNSIIVLLVVQAKTYVFLSNSVGKWSVLAVSLPLSKTCH